MEFTVQRRRQLLNTPLHKTFCPTGVFARKENGRHHETGELETHVFRRVKGKSWSTESLLLMSYLSWDPREEQESTRSKAKNIPDRGNSL